MNDLVLGCGKMFKDILYVRNNMDCKATKDNKSINSSCIDGFRPVIFLIEPYGEINGYKFRQVIIL